MKQKLTVTLLLLGLLLSACTATVAGTETVATLPPEGSSTPQELQLTPSVALPSETPASNKTPQVLQPTPVAEALFVVVKADGSSQGFTWEALKQISLASIQVEGKIEEGPKLMDILTAAGVTDFSEVTLTGTNGSITLPRAQVDENTILDFTNHGTVKMASTYIPKADWIKDITEIKVK